MSKSPIQIFVVFVAAMVLARSLPLLADEKKLPAAAPPAPPALRPLDVERFGIRVQHPPGWTLVLKAQDDKAFVLRLPQQRPEDRTGFVACEVSPAPSDLEEYRKRHATSDEREQQKERPRRTLVENRLVKEGEDDSQPELLLSLWEYPDAGGNPAWQELRMRTIRHDMLYTFILSSDQANFPTYRPTFEEMIATAQFSPPQTGMERIPGGLWMQSKLRFALKLPPDWKPAFGPNQRVLFFATGVTKEVWKDNLMVLADERPPVDLPHLAQTLPGSLAAADPNCRVERCELVAQGTGQALETVVHTTRGPWKITVCERRFRGKNRNYEVRFTCETAQYEKLKDELQKTFTSFLEMNEEDDGVT